MSALAVPSTPHGPEACGLSSTAGHGGLCPCSSSCVSVLHLAVVQACTEGLAHALRVFLIVFHGERGLVPLQGPAIDLLQGQRVLGVVRVLLMGVGMVVVCGLHWLVAVVLLLVLLLLLLSLLRLLFAAGPLLVFDGHHSPLHRAFFETLV